MARKSLAKQSFTFGCSVPCIINFDLTNFADELYATLLCRYLNLYSQYMWSQEERGGVLSQQPTWQKYIL